MALASFEVVVQGQIAGQNCANLLNFATDYTPPVVPYLQDLASQWNTVLQSKYNDCLPEDYLLNGLWVRCNQAGLTSPTYIDLTNAGLIGGRDGKCTSSAVGPVIIAPALGGPSARTMAKIYLPGVSILDLIDNVFQTDLKVAINSFMGQLAGGMTGTYAWQFGIYSRKTDSIYPPSAFFLSNKVGLLRKRSLPVGG